MGKWQLHLILKFSDVVWGFGGKVKKPISDQPILVSVS